METRDTRAIPPELLFEPDGHVTDAALAAMADGEIDLVAQPALDHLDACDRCGRRLGEAALLSIAANDLLRDVPLAAVDRLGSASSSAAAEPAPASRPASSRKRRPLPIAAIAAALCVAAITAGPALVDLITNAPATFEDLVATAPFVMRIAAGVARTLPAGVGSAALVLKLASAALFAVVGLRIASAAQRARSLPGGV